MYTFIVNPHSKSYKGMKIWNQLRPYLLSKKVSFRYFLTQYKGHATQLTKELTQEGKEIFLIVLGGDGTLNEVINGIVSFEKTRISYIPTGSSNDFARSHQLESNPILRMKQILSSNTYRYLDYGEVHFEQGIRRFIVSAGIGYDASVCKEAETSTAKKLLNHLHLGSLTYLFIALKQLFNIKECNGSFSTNTKNYTMNHLIFASVHNHKYEGGGFMFCPDARPDDRILNQCCASDLNTINILQTLPKARNGKHIDTRGVNLSSSSDFIWNLDRSLPLHTDGEYIGDYKNVHFKIGQYKLCMLL